MEPPTSELVRTLSSLGLATAADLRRCSRRVRQLAGGLPTTDSVWIDALVTHQRLTPFQAQALESNRSDSLVVGRKFVLRTPRHLDPRLSVFEATSPGRRERFLISRMPCPAQSGEAAALRLLQTVKNLTGCRAEVPGLPFDALLERESLFLIAPLPEGESLARLLVRRGRFPEEVVRKLAGQLLHQLQMTEPFAAHGDLRLANLWLSRNGDVAMVNFGLLDSVVPSINIHSQLPLDALDGLAPERIETSERSTAASDVYSLGCLLWQLLTGRPPHPVADPLAKLIAQQTKPIPDVRAFAPEVSEPFAQWILALTNRDPKRRPQTCAEAASLLKTGVVRDRRRLRTFARQFESAAPRQFPMEKRKSRIPALATAALVTIGLTVAAWHREQLGWGQLSNLGAAVSTQTTAREADPNTETRVEEFSQSESNPAFASSAAEDERSLESGDSTLLPLPAPDGQGTIRLDASGEYRAGEVIAGESLIIIGDPEQPATIHVRSIPFHLQARHVRLENVRLVVDFPPEQFQGRAPILIQSETLAIQRCRLDWLIATAESSLMTWAAAKRPSEASARLLVRDAVMSSPGPLIAVDVPLSAGLIENVLTHGCGTLIDLRQGVSAGLRVPLILNRCTFRECAPVVKLPARDVLLRSGLLSLQGEDSVIQLAQGDPVIHLDPTSLDARWTQHVEVDAASLIVEVGAQLVGMKDSSSGFFTAVPSDALQVNGVLSGDFHFESATIADGRFDRLIIDALPVRNSTRQPGVLTDRIPVSFLKP